MVSSPYLSILPSAWFVSMAPWNIYHGGLQFRCSEVLKAIRTLAGGAHEDLDNEIKNMTKFEYGWSVIKALRMALSGDMIPGLEWRNFGILRLRDFWPDEYTNRTKVGVMTGEQFDELKRWFVEDWARSRDTFDPITIINADTGGRIWMSRMCHDLVEYGFKRLAEMKIIAMDLVPVGYLMGQYYEAEVVSPLVNYCYVPLRMPRTLANGTVVFGQVDAMNNNRSLCALKNSDVILEYEPSPAYEPDDTVDIYVGEYKIASWFVSMAPWNIYHGGLQFRCRRTNYTYTIDYNAKFDSNITHFLVPTEKYEGHLDDDGFPTGDMIPGLEWRNFGILRFRDFWPKEYSTRTLVGNMTGGQFDTFKRWFLEDWARPRDTFDPVTVIKVDSGERIWMSRMCHDLVEYGLRQLVEMGIPLRSTKSVFRDHIPVYVNYIKPLDVRGNGFDRRAVVRFLRLYMSFIPQMREQFIHSRDMLRKALAMGLIPVGYFMGSYYELDIVPPLINYCYIPLNMPHLLPNGSAVFGPVDAMNPNLSLCALPNVNVELGNVTLTIEDRLIMLENYLDLLFNAPERLRHPKHRSVFMMVTGTIVCGLLMIVYWLRSHKP
ncbi:hypothetical protein Pmar_PMAR000675 [Perkinsus marinus ATCC 50983]|uniref:Uncharacterized protein n=1 Tax=Perkinsus marinus (strain ATCC 50983 / TXsc) TaxID=423536 RepID=C5KRG6_PERM5|nr:hypothetical protein Pmar_PMAR000675 [Perkinsus marinus ATCC 50983]EER12939.1 hypothetical protein Pmar_PMAR000675 [Perkinsus marinus ATCC 50983]|eukprot:XP_002781144.1 hypothetical protein Pmar_PMAR000675 [Perkinsus marinus ATCC 50983]